MPITKSRQIAKLLKLDGTVKDSLYDSDAIVTSAQLGVAAAAGTTVYSSADTLPTSATNGDQALVSSTNRLYIYSNGGWYNIALINTTPYWSSEASSSYDLNIDGTATTITILAVDSEGIPITYTATADSDFNQIATITKDSDNGRTFTVIPTDSENGTAVAGSGTVTFKASDGVNLVSTLSTFSIAFQVLNANYTTLLLKADNDGTDNQVDASSNSITITEYGNTTSTSYSPYHPGGYSVYFDGLGDKEIKTTAKHAHLALSSNSDWTMEGYFNFPVVPTGASQYRVVAACRDASYNGPAIYLDESPTKVKVLAGGGSVVITGTTTIERHKWYHIALVNEAAGNMKLYVDGNLEGSYAYADTPGDCDVWIMGNGDGSTQNNQGYVRDLRIVDGTAVYTSAFTKPSSTLSSIAGTEFFFANTPYIRDTSSNNVALTYNDASKVSVERIGPYDTLGYSISSHGGSVYFDGSGDYITSASDNGLIASGNGFTIEGWVYWTNLRSANEFVVAATTGANNYEPYWFIGSSTSNNWRYSWGNAASVNSSIPIRANQWNHFAMVVTSGGAGTLYINGKSEATATGISLNGSATGVAMSHVGGGPGVGTLHITGYIADVRYVNNSSVYTAEFTPPTAPLTAISGTQFLSATNKNDIWDASFGSLLTKYGNVTASTTQAKFATSSIYFDGSGDWIHLPASDQLEPLGNDFTFEWWWYPTTLSQRQWFFHTATDYWLGVDYQNNSGRGLGMWASSNGSSWNLINSDNGGNGISSTAPTLNAWNHIAYTRNGNTFTLWLNGTSIVSVGSITASIVDRSTQSKVIGSWAQSNHQFPIVGYIQDFRVTKGLARYTSSFTPPTAEFDG